MSDDRRPDILVVGAGAVGVSAAYELARRGAAVHVLETEDGPGRGCSFANAGLLVPSRMEPLTTPANVRAGLRHMWNPSSPFYLAPRPSILPWLARYVLASRPASARATTELLRHLGAESFQMHQDYAAAGIDTGFRQDGFLDVFSSETRFSTAKAKLEDYSVGFEPQYLDAGELKDLAPGLSGVAGGIYYPREGYCDTARYVASVLAAAEKQGAVTHTRTRVLRLNHRAQRVTSVTTNAGDFSPGAVILAAGVESRELARSVGLHLPIEPGKGYVLDLEASVDDPKTPIGVRESKIVITPYPDRLRLAGTMELSGHSKTVNQRRSAAIFEAAIRTLPHLRDRRLRSAWVGLRPCTADGAPIVGRSERCSNLVLATGHGQQGLILAPVSGRLVAEQVVGERGPDPVLESLSPDRFRVPLAKAG